jgi:uncharacterized protein with GYD domain
MVPTYISFFQYTGEAWRQMVDRPADRAEAARAAIEDAGGTMSAFYWMLGEYDGLVVYTMPSEIAAAAYSAAVTTSGRIALQRTHQLLDSGQAQNALTLASRLRTVYRPPGAAENWRVEYDAMGR